MCYRCLTVEPVSLEPRPNEFIEIAETSTVPPEALWLKKPFPISKELLESIGCNHLEWMQPPNLCSALLMHFGFPVAHDPLMPKHKPEELLSGPFFYESYFGLPGGALRSGMEVEAKWGALSAWHMFSTVDDLPDSAVDNRPPSPDTEVPDGRLTLEGSVIGYRAWRINFDEWLLEGTGYNHNGLWSPGINKAEHRDHRYEASHPNEPAPGEYCHCGLNALARFSDDESWWETADENQHAQVVGAVEAWSDETDPRLLGEGQTPGRFILHRTGFRAQYARIVLLAIEDGWPRAKTAAVKALATEYGADICKREHLEDAAKEHGQLIPDELLKWAGRQDPPISGPFFGQIAHHVIRTEPLLVSPSFEALKGLNPHKGPKLTLKTVGPPTLGKHRRGDVVADTKGRRYICVKSGSPGSWTRTEEV